MLLSQLAWTTTTPTKTGMYIFKFFAQWHHRLCDVRKGDYRFKQNPEWFYAGLDEKPVQNMNGWWLGPLPKAPSSAYAREPDLEIEVEES